jgi:uncharacterized lipoprotein
VKTFSGRNLRHGLAVAAVAVLGLSACDSQPSAKRVAEDLVKTLTEDPAEQQCMLDVIDDYDEEYDLAQLGDDAENGDLNSQGEALDALAAYEQSLEDCRN